MARHRKPPDQRANTSTVDAGLVIPTAPTRTPPVVGTWQEGTKRAWKAFWRGPLAKLVVPSTDLHALFRLFSLYDSMEVDGYSSGKDSAILKLEDRFGFSPKARLAMSIVVNDRPTLEGLAAIPDSADDEEDDGFDPRALLVDGSTGGVSAAEVRESAEAS